MDWFWRLDFDFSCFHQYQLLCGLNSDNCNVWQWELPVSWSGSWLCCKLFLIFLSRLRSKSFDVAFDSWCSLSHAWTELGSCWHLTTFIVFLWLELEIRSYFSRHQMLLCFKFEPIMVLQCASSFVENEFCLCLYAAIFLACSQMEIGFCSYFKACDILASDMILIEFYLIVLIPRLHTGSDTSETSLILLLSHSVHNLS